MTVTKEMMKINIENSVKSTRDNFQEFIQLENNKNTLGLLSERIKNMDDQRASGIITLYTEKNHHIEKIDRLNGKNAFLFAVKQFISESREVTRFTRERELKHVLEMLGYLRAYNAVKEAMQRSAVSILI